MGHGTGRPLRPKSSHPVPNTSMPRYLRVGVAVVQTAMSSLAEVALCRSVTFYPITAIIIQVIVLEYVLGTTTRKSYAVHWSMLTPAWVSTYVEQLANLLGLTSRRINFEMLRCVVWFAISASFLRSLRRPAQGSQTCTRTHALFLHSLSRTLSF